MVYRNNYINSMFVGLLVCWFVGFCVCVCVCVGGWVGENVFLVCGTRVSFLSLIFGACGAVFIYSMF